MMLCYRLNYPKNTIRAEMIINQLIDNSTQLTESYERKLSDSDTIGRNVHRVASSCLWFLTIPMICW